MNNQRGKMRRANFASIEGGGGDIEGRVFQTRRFLWKGIQDKTAGALSNKVVFQYEGGEFYFRGKAAGALSI
jgi:hypothetical protein